MQKQEIDISKPVFKEFTGCPIVTRRTGFNHFFLSLQNEKAYYKPDSNWNDFCLPDTGSRDQSL